MNGRLAHRTTGVLALLLAISCGGDSPAGPSDTPDSRAPNVRLVINDDDDGQGSLRQAVATAEPGDVVRFDTDGFFAEPRIIDLRSEIVLDRDLTIEGPRANDVTISGGDAVRVFRVDASATVVLSGLTVANGFAEHGGGILIGTGSALTLRAVSVTGSRAELAGGGVYNLGALEVLDGSTVVGNEAPAGGGMANGPGAEATLDNAMIGGPSPSEANAAARGGGILNEGVLAVRADSRILGNRATDASGFGRGGGIFNETDGQTTISGSTVGGLSPEAANGADLHGGGVYNLGDLAIMEASRVSGNQALLGGGIYNEIGGETTFSGSTAVGNTAARSGGGMYNVGQLHIRNASSVSGNHALGVESSDGGGGIYNLRTLEIAEDSKVAGNAAAASGGGIYNSDTSLSHVRISGSTIGGLGPEEANTAARGGGVYNDRTLVIREGSRVLGNEATGSESSDGGGGIYNDQGGRTTIGGSNVGGSSPVEANVAAHGGGIHNHGELVIEEASRVVGNRAEQNGGGILSAQGSSTIIDRGRVSDNEARRGGGIYNRGKVEITGGNVVLNSASVAGAGIYNIEEMHMEGSFVLSNKTDGDGGGIFNNGGTVTIEGNSSAGVGGVNDNEAGVRGGGIYNQIGSTLTLSAETAALGLRRNTARRDAPSGGGLWNRGTLHRSGTFLSIGDNTPDDIAP